MAGVRLEPLTDKLSGTITASVFKPWFFYFVISKLFLSLYSILAYLLLKNPQRQLGVFYFYIMKILTEEQYLSQNGACRQDIGDPALHKNRGAMSDKTWTSIVDAQAEKDYQLIERRSLLRIEYWQKVANGELRPPNRTEQLLEIAKGNPEHESVRAARRLLAKRKINLE